MDEAHDHDESHPWLDRDVVVCANNKVSMVCWVEMIQVWREKEEEGRGGRERREGEREGEEGEEGGRGGRERGKERMGRREGEEEGRGRGRRRGVVSYQSNAFAPGPFSNGPENKGSNLQASEALAPHVSDSSRITR